MKKIIFLFFALGLLSLGSCRKDASVTPDVKKTELQQNVDSKSADGLLNLDTGTEYTPEALQPPGSVISFSATAGDLSSTWTPTFDYSLVTSWYWKTTINIYFRKPGVTSWTFIAKANRTWVNYSTKKAGFAVNKVYGWGDYPSYGETYFMATSNPSSNPPSTLPMMYNPESVRSSTRIQSNCAPYKIMHFTHPYF